MFLLLSRSEICLFFRCLEDPSASLLLLPATNFNFIFYIEFKISVTAVLSFILLCCLLSGSNGNYYVFLNVHNSLRTSAVIKCF